MLETIHLDDETFEDIVEDVMKRIPLIYPEWTNHNASDSGIVLVELFAWLKEMQQYHLDQVSDAVLRQYLKLLGIRLKHKQAAIAGIRCLSDYPLYIQEGTRFYADTLTFESEKSMWIRTEKELILSHEGPKLKQMYEPKSREVMKSKTLDYILNRMYEEEFDIFGDENESYPYMYIELDYPLSEERQETFFLEMSSNYEKGRNTIDQSCFEPLTYIACEYLCQEGWKPVDAFIDDTLGFLQSGFIKLKISEVMLKLENKYWLRFYRKSGHFDRIPRLKNVYRDQVRLIQKRSRVLARIITGSKELKKMHRLFSEGKKVYYECLSRQGLYKEIKGKDLEGLNSKAKYLVLAYEEEFGLQSQKDMTGFPNQEIELDEFCWSQGIRLMVEESMQSGVFREWDQVDSFVESGPGDCHFVVDEEGQCIRFGNGFCGACPEGRLQYMTYVETSGNQGNVKESTINEIENENRAYDELINIQHLKAAYGGRKEESIQEGFEDYIDMKRQGKRIVTENDYERKVSVTPGLCIKNVKARVNQQKGRPLTMDVIVHMDSDLLNPKLSQAYINIIRRWLEPFRMLGTDIRILSPEYIGIDVYVQVQVNIHEEEARQKLDSALRVFFEEAGQDFGEAFSSSRLYGHIDQLDFIIDVQGLTLYATGQQVQRKKNGDIQLPVNGIAYFRECNYEIIQMR